MDLGPDEQHGKAADQDWQRPAFDTRAFLERLWGSHVVAGLSPLARGPAEPVRPAASTTEPGAGAEPGQGLGKMTVDYPPIGDAGAGYVVKCPACKFRVSMASEWAAWHVAKQHRCPS